MHSCPSHKLGKVVKPSKQYFWHIGLGWPVFVFMYLFIFHGFYVYLFVCDLNLGPLGPSFLLSSFQCVIPIFTSRSKVIDNPNSLSRHNPIQTTQNHKQCSVTYGRLLQMCQTVSTNYSISSAKYLI